MFEHLEKIRQKNKKQKQLYAFSVAFIFSGLILLIWYISIVPGFIDEGKREKKVSELGSSPTNSFATVIKGGISIFKEQGETIKEKINELNLDSINSPAHFNSATTGVETESVSQNE